MFLKVLEINIILERGLNDKMGICVCNCKNKVHKGPFFLTVFETLSIHKRTMPLNNLWKLISQHISVK